MIYARCLPEHPTERSKPMDSRYQWTVKVDMGLSLGTPFWIFWVGFEGKPKGTVLEQDTQKLEGNPFTQRGRATFSGDFSVRLTFAQQKKSVKLPAD